MGPTISALIGRVSTQACPFDVVMLQVLSYRTEYYCRVEDSTIIGMPTPRNIADRMKNMMMVLVRVGTGCQAFSICCLNWSSSVSYYYWGYDSICMVAGVCLL